MAALKEVRQRIRAVRGIGQVTKAMKMVATVKMKRIQGRLIEARPYVEGLDGLAGRLARVAAESAFSHELLDRREGGEPLMVVIGSDRGLCGSFNMNLFRAVQAAVAEGTRFVLVGRKAVDYFTRRGARVDATYDRLPFPVSWEDAERIGRNLVTMYGFGALSSVTLAYQRFIAAGTSRPTLAPWLPFATPDGPPAADLNCEPSVPEVLDRVLPRALVAKLHQALLESQGSEQGSRMVAMDNATTNATELQGDLTLLANKLRQSGITKELLEITSGTEALNA